MEDQATQQPIPEEQTTGQEAPAEATELNISDLQALKAIIDVASGRGAFKANELEAVGKTYNRLNNFLTQVTKGQ
jgi:hypothetical protein